MRNEKSIHQLMQEQETTHKTFFVPSYQRGYRWQRVNVSDLLNDLCEFIHNEKATYSLQPLVVFESDDNTYHVVDGQQRLTTISILLGYLGLKQISICYESRKGRQENRFVEECKNIDQYHVNKAFITIKEWFEKHPGEKEGFVELLNGTLDKQVIFIWYCTTDDEVATFVRLNKDKISLTNAELIKAMLLKKGNFSGDRILMQKNIAIEWNNIENTFNDDAFWCFIDPKKIIALQELISCLTLSKERTCYRMSLWKKQGMTNILHSDIFTSISKKRKNQHFMKFGIRSTRYITYWYIGIMR